MRKLIFFLILFFSFIPKAFALDFPKIKINQNILDVLTSPTPTPTQTPTNIPSPNSQPTEILTPTETPILTETTVPVETQSQTQLETTPNSPPQLSPANQKTPTPTQKPTKNLTQKEMIMYGLIGFLFLVILLQNWPKIKKWLHEKTE